MWVLHERELLMVTPSILALSITSSSFLLTITGSKSVAFMAKEILNFSHLSALRWTLLSYNHWITWSAIHWALLALPLGMNFDAVVSSTNCQRCGALWFCPTNVVNGAERCGLFNLVWGKVGFLCERRWVVTWLTTWRAAAAFNMTSIFLVFDAVCPSYMASLTSKMKSSLRILTVSLASWVIV